MLPANYRPNHKKTAHKMDLPKSVVILAACFTCALFSMAMAEDPVLKLEPRPDQAVQVEKSTNFKCSIENKTFTIEWVNKDGSKISNNNRTRIYSDGGVLNINSVNLNDSGSYICRTTDRSLNATAELEVYVMPSYFTEGMIIVGINCGLIVLFILCGVHSLIEAKRDKKRRKEETYKKSAPI